MTTSTEEDKYKEQIAKNVKIYKVPEVTYEVRSIKDKEYAYQMFKFLISHDLEVTEITKMFKLRITVCHSLKSIYSITDKETKTNMKLR